jgi:WD40 repeat protein
MSLSKAVEEKEVPEEWLPGDVILDTYEVISCVGGGTFGLVQRVRHEKWKIDMAVKTLKPAATLSENARAAFLKVCEGWIELGLHPHVATCYYIRELGGHLRIFTEFVEGGSLSEWIDDGKIKTLPMSLEIALQCLGGLSHAHRKGVLHRDIKPANCLMTLSGKLKITDFGITSAPGREATQGGAVGTPAYMPPEAWENGIIGPWSDIYSFGAMLFELCCGKLPFVDETEGVSTLRALHCEAPVPSPAEIKNTIPACLSEYIVKCLSKRPEDRYGSCEDAYAGLMAVYKECAGKSLSPVMPEEQSLLADGLNTRALAFLDLGKVPEALKCFDEALEVIPHHPESTYNRGLVLWRRGALDDEQCIRAMEEVCQSTPDDPMAGYLTALIHLERGDNEKALAILKKIPGKFEGYDRVQALIALTAEKGSAPSNLLKDSMVSYETLSASALCDSCEHLFFSTEKYMAGEGETMPIESWDTRRGERYRIFGVPNRICSLCLSHDENFVAASSSDTTVDIWEVESGCCAYRLEGHSSPVSRVLLSADDHLLLSLGTDSTLRLWDLAKRECLLILRQDDLYPGTLAATKDFKYAFTTSGDRNDMGTIMQWDLTRGRLARRIPGHTRTVTDIIISPDGKSIVSSGMDGTIRIWDMESGASVKTFAAPKTEFWTLAVTGDCRSIVSGDKNGAVAFWDFESGKIRQVLEGHTRLIRRILLIRGDKFLVSLSEDGSVKVWDRTPGISVGDYQGLEQEVLDITAMKDEDRLLISRSGTLGREE